MSLIDTYFTLATTGESLYTEKRSKFLGFAIPIQSEEEAKALIKAYKKDYFDARHVCYAYALGQGGAHYRSNDDGEPSGTAGKPILGQIKSHDLTNVLVIVVRYYGGTPLGTGNLGRAYQTTADEALKRGERKEEIIKNLVTVVAPFEEESQIYRLARDNNASITSIDYTAKEVRLTLSIRAAREETLRNQLGLLYKLKVLPEIGKKNDA